MKSFAGKKMISVILFVRDIFQARLYLNKAVNNICIKISGTREDKAVVHAMNKRQLPIILVQGCCYFSSVVPACFFFFLIFMNITVLPIPTATTAAEGTAMYR
jgi:hypothetical protein